MKIYSEILKKCPLFKNITEDDINSILGCMNARVKEFQKNEIVISEGEKADFIGIVLTGSLNIEKTDYFGNRSIVSKVTPSELFAETFACANVEEIPVDVISNEASRIMFIDCNRVIHSCSNSCEFHRKIIFNLMNVIATKNLMFHQKIEITSKRTTREKLMTYLLSQAKKTHSDTIFIPYTRQELADFLNVDRSGLSAEISKLRRENIIDCKKNKFTLKKELK